MSRYHRRRKKVVITMGGRKNRKKTRNLVLVFGDQLDSGSAAFDDFDTGKDAVLMMEVKKPPSVAKKSADGVAVS